MTLRRYRWPALLLLVVHVQACTSWRTSSRPVEEVLSDPPAAIRITTVDGRTRTLREPRLFRDSVGTARSLEYCPRDRPDPCPAHGPDGESLTPTALARIASVEVREFSTPRTIGVVLLTGVAAIAAAFLAACAGDDSGLICE